MMRVSVLTAVLLAVGTLAAAAQEKQIVVPNEVVPVTRGAVQEGEQAGGVPLKVTVVLSRYQGDKRLSTLPYVLGVTSAPRAGGGAKTSLRMNIDVPVLQTVFGQAKGDNPAIPQASYSYRSVGTSIDCQAAGLASGVFQLTMTVADSSLQLQRPMSELLPEALRNVPVFRTMNSSFSVLMRDGQTSQHTSATDPVSGEVMRIDVTLNVVK